MEKSSSGRCDSYESWNGISVSRYSGGRSRLWSEIVEIVEEDSITPCADQIVIYYRVHNGRRQKRRWNKTQGKWVDKNWIDLGPAY